MTIFISYAHEDAKAALSIYELLDKKGYSPWIDKRNLLPGQDWELEIDEAIRKSDIFIACLSTNSVSQRGYFLAELKKAIKVLNTVPEEDVFLIPVRIDDCKVPSKIMHLHWLDYFAEDGPAILVASIIQHLGPTFVPEMVFIPAGEFLMGSEPRKDKDAEENEQPQHHVYVSEFSLGKYPVTNQEYQAFMQATYRRLESSSEVGFLDDKGNHPVCNISWHNAMAYCEWLAETTGKPYRLPTEAEWEKAARGTDGRIYPWGNQWDKTKCNTDESDIRCTTPVGQYSPQGDSPYSCADMVGNVWQWCADWFCEAEYSRRAAKKVNNPQGPEKGNSRILRGGFLYYRWNVRCAARIKGDPASLGDIIGFRVALSISDSD